MRNFLFTEFDNKVSVDVLHELNHMISHNDDWMPTKKYLFEHMVVPEELVKKDPYLEFIYDRFGKVLPWILCVRPYTEFVYHTDQSKGCAINFSVNGRKDAITVFRQNASIRRMHWNIRTVDYSTPGRLVLLNNMKQHMVLNYSDSPIYTFTIPCMLMREDYKNILHELDELVVFDNIDSDGEESTYRPDSKLKMPTSDKLTPIQLEILIFAKVQSILLDNGFMVS